MTIKHESWVTDDGHRFTVGDMVRVVGGSGPSLEGRLVSLVRRDADGPCIALVERTPQAGVRQVGVDKLRPPLMQGLMQGGFP